MLRLKEEETQELGEGKFMFSPFSNEGGEVNFFLKVILKSSLLLSEICIPSISNI